MAYDYQQDFPAVLFSTFKPLPGNREEPEGIPGIQHPDHPDQHPDKERQERSRDAPHRDTARTGEQLKEETYQWFEQTQRRKLIRRGQFPEWFHGFVTRKRAEDRLQEQPPGTYLIRFCESRVGFVLSYRGSERCRHFVLSQREDERYIIEGEESAHPQLQDLIAHYSAHPVQPYQELLSTPCPAVTPPPNTGNCRRPDSPGLLQRPPSSPPGGQVVRPAQEMLGAGPVSPVQKKEHIQAEPKAAVLSQEPEASLGEEPAANQYASVRKSSGGGTEESGGPAYASIKELHTHRQPEPRADHHNQDPIAFYAMGRSSCWGHPENVYSEVTESSPTPQSARSLQSRSSTVPPASSREASRPPKCLQSSFKQPPPLQEYSQVSRGKSHGSKTNPKSKQQQQQRRGLFDDPGCGRSILSLPPEEPENIYEKIPENAKSSG